MKSYSINMGSEKEPHTDMLPLFNILCIHKVVDTLEKLSIIHELTLVNIIKVTKVLPETYQTCWIINFEMEILWTV